MDTKEKLTKQQIEERLLKIIFGDKPIKESDCNNCPYFYECDGNVNGCRL